MMMVVKRKRKGTGLGEEVDDEAQAEEAHDDEDDAHEKGHKVHLLCVVRRARLR